MPNRDSLALINILAKFHVNYKQNNWKKFIINKFTINGSFQMSFSKYVYVWPIYLLLLAMIAMQNFSFHKYSLDYVR